MDGRISAWLLTIPLATLCTGCITPSAQKTTTATPRAEDMPKVVKKDDGPKRDPKPATEVAFGKMKEGEADSDAGKAHPEQQAQLRDEARKAYQHALQIDPNNLDAHRALGRLYAKMGDYERAFDVYKKAMAKHPKNADLWYDLGLCHNRRKDFGESVRCFTKALDADPENRDYLKMLGFTLAWTGKVDQALIYLSRAQGAAQAHVEIACMFDQKDQRELAIQHLRLALRENPQLQTARDLLTAFETPHHGQLGTAVPAFGG